jgi:hypothetical protein
MKTLAAVLLVASCVGSSAHAETRSFRCKNDLVNLGDAKAEVLLKCGEPAVRHAFCQAPNTRNANGQGTRPRADLPCVNVDEWTYKPGYGQFLTTLRFEEDRLQAIVYGDRQ